MELQSCNTPRNESSMANEIITGGGGLFVAYLENVVAGDTLTIKPQHTMYIGYSCVIYLN